jgi:biofilm PGA synthesis N-glycosyltransferase PgaC
MVLVMDADTELDDDFVARACAALRGRVGAVGGIFLGRQGGGVLEQLQRNEYARYAREIHRRGDVAKVLTGTATLFRAGVLREVAVERGHRLPGRPGDFYDASALTEDNEITLALKTLGYACISPAGCTVRTELMPTWADLWRQRKRWQRGAVDNLRAYGFTRVTAPYIVKQVLVGAGVMAFALYLAMTVLTLAVAHTMSPSPVWTSIGGLFVAERCWTVRREGWRGVALALALLPEMAFDVILQAVWVASVVAAARRSEARWHHVPAPTRRIACTTA